MECTESFSEWPKTGEIKKNRESGVRIKSAKTGGKIGSLVEVQDAP